jgi:hypothetical protein
MILTILEMLFLRFIVEWVKCEPTNGTRLRYEKPKNSPWLG